MKIFLDLDGVLCDFVGGIERKFKMSLPLSFDFDDLPQILGMSTNKLFKSLDLDFWTNLEKTSFADYLVGEVIGLVGADNVAILTAPALSNVDSIVGKIAWVKKYYKDIYDRGNIVLSVNKKIIVDDKSVLFDDRESNIKAWESAGGKGVLVPAPINMLWNQMSSSIEIIGKAIDILKKLGGC